MTSMTTKGDNMEDNKLDEVLTLLKSMQKGKLTHDELIIIRQIIQEKKEEAELRRVIKQRVLSKGAIAIAVGLGAALFYGLNHMIKPYF